MARKRYELEESVSLLRQAELLHVGREALSPDRSIVPRNARPEGWLAGTYGRD